jgi:hypothetical protein
MIGQSIRVGFAFASVGFAGLFIACSGGDSGSSSSTASYADMVAAIKKPTGTVSATSVTPVAQEFEKVTSSGLGGYRQVQETQDVSSQMCTAGGTAKATGSGSETAGNVTISYNGCCMEASCCVDGTIGTVYNSDSTGTSEYSSCVDMNVTVECDAQSAVIKSAGCLNQTGEFVYSITVSGNSYSVSGYYSNGSGQLTIVGENGSWTCTYTNDTGTCTGTGGDFTF